ncbi:MAG TPA: hypothetical protein VHJ39_18600 [Solirubrobacteraceae bacterium]|nr:hypothetical protein [Solirubrobacteraceae bacterium]
MRLVALGALLFAVYLAGLGIDPAAGEEVTYRLIANALIEDGQLVREPEGLGFPLLIAPAEALGVVEPFLAAVAALGFVLGAVLARRIVPEPYASGGALLVGLSPPAVAHAGAIAPGMTAGTLLAGAMVCAVGAREAAGAARVLGAAALLAVLPWLDPLLVIPALPVAVALFMWCRLARRPTLALIAAELIVGSIVVYATVNEQLFGQPTPGPVTDAVDGAPGLVWTPILALAVLAAWRLWRSRREQLARAIPARATAEAAAGLALAVCAAQLLVAVLLVAEPPEEPFPGRELTPMLPAAAALVAWGLRHAPRIGAALGAVTVGLSVWVLFG